MSSFVSSTDELPDRSARECPSRVWLTNSNNSLQCLILFARTSTYPKQRQVQISSIIFLPLSSCRSQLPVPPSLGGRQYPPQSAPAQAPQGTSDFVDGSGPIFSMYLEMATEDDKKMAENWKADADGILIFVRPYR